MHVSSLKDTNISNHLYIFLKYYFLCGGACVHSVLVKVRRELVGVVSFHHMGLRDWTQVVRLGDTLKDWNIWCINTYLALGKKLYITYEKLIYCLQRLAEISPVCFSFFKPRNCLYMVQGQKKLSSSQLQFSFVSLILGIELRASWTPVGALPLR